MLAGLVQVPFCCFIISPIQIHEAELTIRFALG
jgi:hypothetical protein